MKIAKRRRLRPLALVAVVVLYAGCSEREPPAERFVMNTPGWQRMEAIQAVAGYGDLEGTRKLLRRGVHVDARNYNDETPLMTAAAQNQVEEVQLLIEHGADVNAESFLKMTPLMFAARAGDARVVRLLLDAGARVDTLGERGFTALTHAAAKGRIEAAEELLLAGADPWGGGYRATSTPVELARQRGSAELVGLLVTSGADGRPPRPSSGSRSRRRPEPSTEEPSEEPSIIAHYERALFEAAASRDTWRVQEVLDKGDYLNIDTVDAHGRTALGIAAQANNLEMVEMLLDAGAWVDHPQDSPSRTPLVLALRSPKQEVAVAHLLLQAGANPDVQPLLASLASTGKREFCMALIEAGADVNLTRSDGSSALGSAAARCDVELMEALISAGADVNYRNQYGSTALKAAKRGRRPECPAAYDLLVRAGAEEPT